MSPMTHNNAQHQGMLRLSLKSQSNNQAATFPLDFIAGFGFNSEQMKPTFIGFHCS